MSTYSNRKKRPCGRGEGAGSIQGKTAGQSQRRGQRGARTRQPAATSPTQKSARRSSMRKSTSVQNPGPATAESSEGPPSSTGVPHRHRAGCNSQDRHGGGGDPRHWQPGTFSRRRRSCDSLHDTGDSGSFPFRRPLLPAARRQQAPWGFWFPPSADRNCLPLFRYGFIIPARLCGDSSPV